MIDFAGNYFFVIFSSFSYGIFSTFFRKIKGVFHII